MTFSAVSLMIICWRRGTHCWIWIWTLQTLTSRQNTATLSAGILPHRAPPCPSNQMMMQVSKQLQSFLFLHVIHPRRKSAFCVRLSDDFTFLINVIVQSFIYQQLCFSIKSLSFLCVSPPYLPEHPCSTGFLDKALAKSSVYHWKLGIPGRQPTLTLAHSFCQFVRLSL